MPAAQPKKLLFISRHAPYGSSLAKDALDAILAASVYEQDIALLFIDDGIFQLLPAQDSRRIGQKSFSALLQALPLYEIDKIYVHSESLEKREITINDFGSINIQIIDSAAVALLRAEQDHILSF